MMEKSGISFIRIDILENWRFWNQFAKTKDYEAAGKEVIAQAEALLEQDPTANKRVAQLLAEGQEFQKKKSEAGKKGGLARAKKAGETIHCKDNQPPTTPLKPRNQPKEPHQPTKDELYLFADTEHLDVADAREWYEINYVDRPGCDKNGEVIKNWKGHCKRYCQAKLNKRNQENENSN